MANLALDDRATFAFLYMVSSINIMWHLINYVNINHMLNSLKFGVYIIFTVY